MRPSAAQLDVDGGRERQHARQQQGGCGDVESWGPAHVVLVLMSANGEEDVVKGEGAMVELMTRLPETVIG